MTEKFKVSERPLTALLTSWQQAEGRTLASVIEETSHRHDYLVFRFTDGSGLLLHHYDNDITFCSYDCEPDDLSSHSELGERVYFGLEPLEPYLRHLEEYEAAREAEQEQRERRQLAELKQKYGE